MPIYGTALLAACTLLGVGLGELLGRLLEVKANVGGVGLAMVLLIVARGQMARRGLLHDGVRRGVGFWAAMYIPIVVAMAAQQNVKAALSGGPMVMITGVGIVAVCFALVAVFSRSQGGAHD